MSLLVFMLLKYLYPLNIHTVLKKMLIQISFLCNCKLLYFKSQMIMILLMEQGQMWGPYYIRQSTHSLGSIFEGAALGVRELKFTVEFSHQ